MRLDPAGGVANVAIGPVNILAGEEFLEVVEDGVVGLEVLVDGMRGHVERREVEEDVFVDQLVLEAVGGGRLDFLVGRDAAAAIDGTARVSQLNLAAGRVGGRRPAARMVVIVVERDACVIALDEAAGRRVVVIRSEGKAGVFTEVVNGLHQALAEGGFAHDQGAIVILQRAGNDLGRRGGVAVHQHDDGKGLAIIAVGRDVVLIGVGAAALRDDGLALGKQVVADIHGLA